jgi:hypothetical protein
VKKLNFKGTKQDPGRMHVAGTGAIQIYLISQENVVYSSYPLKLKER